MSENIFLLGVMTSQHYNEFWSDSDPHMKKVESGSRGRNITRGREGHKICLGGALLLGTITGNGQNWHSMSIACQRNSRIIYMTCPLKD